MKQYIFSNNDAQAREIMAAKLTDGKHGFSVFFAPGEETIFTAEGKVSGHKLTTPDRDAVQIPADADDKAIANVRRIAAGRETVRRYEDIAAGILSKGAENLTDADRMALLNCINVAYHDGGKIGGCYSVDSSAACDFCQRMRAAALENLLIICGGCYAAADSYKEFSWRRHKLNALILSTVLFTVEELKTLNIPDGSRVRINEDGDTVNEIHARNILRLFVAFNTCRFGYWYKNIPAVAAGLAAEGVRTRKEKLSVYGNARFIQSSLLIGFPARPVWFTDAVFTVYPDDNTTLAAIAAGAFECNGRRCFDCGYWCYTPENNGGAVPNIAEKLRCGKAARAAIMAAYEARKAQEKMTA